MLRLSKMSDYAVVALASLADGQSQSCASIALRTNLSEPTIAKVMKLLSKKNVVQSTRGTAGGYQIAAAPDQISVLSIVEAIDGPIVLTDCVDGGEGCSFHVHCGVKGQWDPVANAIKEALRNVTLENMINRKPELKTA